MKAVSIYDLAEEIHLARGIPFEDALEIVRQYVRDHWTENDIRMGLKAEGDNLIDPDAFYYHSQLQIVPPPPVLSFDPETGDIRQSGSQEWFLEMRASYRPIDLFEYYVRRLGLKELTPDNQSLGSFRWLVRTYGLEQVLFMVDAWAGMMAVGDLDPPTSPLMLKELAQQAREAYEQKVTEMHEMGVTQVVPRKRVPVHRAGSPEPKWFI